MNPRSCSWVLLAGSVALAAGPLTACKQNPFPEVGKITPLEPEPPRAVAPPYGLKVPARAVFEEGKTGSVSILAWVPAPGNAQVQIEGLPSGAVFDASALKIEWMPGFSDGNEPSDALSTSREYPIRVVMVNSADPTTALTGETTLVVKDVPRPIEALGAAAVAATENVAFVQEIELKSADFPTGPFQLNASGLPAGAVVARKPGSQTVFTLSYAPDSSVVRFSSASSANTRTFTIDLTAVGPNQAKVSKQVRWTVTDARNFPRVSTPGEVTQGPDVNFVVSAEDLNGEVAPTLTLLNPAPFGRIALTPLRVDGTLPTDRNPVSVINVGWTGIPANQMGTRRVVDFSVCVKRTQFQQNHCKTESVAVNLQPVARLGASFDRAAWPMGETKLAQEGAAFTVRLPVTELDPETGSFVPSVEVQPRSLAASGEVRWDAGTKSVVIEPKSAGTKQFNLVATSYYGVQQFESFVYDALPASRSPVLILGESLQNPEVQAALRFLPGAQVVNPSLQPLAARDLAFRDAVVAGTSALKDAQSLVGLELAAEKIKNVILQTPLMDRLPVGLKAELSGLGAEGRGRLLELSDPVAPALRLLRLFMEPLGLLPPTGPYALAGSLTSESPSPWIWKSPATASCRTLASLQSEAPGAQALPVVQECARGRGQGQGRIVLSGLELGDIELAGDADSETVRNWVGQWVKR